VARRLGLEELLPEEVRWRWRSASPLGSALDPRAEVAPLGAGPGGLYGSLTLRLRVAEEPEPTRRLRLRYTARATEQS